jgi:phosphatidylserine/phosphatidylglycerophosphate/cardiolipin synthase-like enzyme
MNALLLNTTGADWLFDKKYHSFLYASFLQARKSILIQQFVIDPRPSEDKDSKVRQLLSALGDAVQRGVEVRVLLASVIVDTPYPIDINTPTAMYLRKRNVKIRSYVNELNEQMHTKSVVIDAKKVIVGSHNWTPNSFNNNIETSIVVNAADAALYMTNSFNKLWAKSIEYDF